MSSLPPILDPAFASALTAHGLAPLRRGAVTTLQVNVGKLCNQACLHCHVEAGPKRTERMTESTADRVLALLDATGSIETLDITGGAPELNPNFRRMVRHGRSRGLRVIDRCNLTVFFEPEQADLPSFLAQNEIEITASLPCYTPGNVDAQRGRGVFSRSIQALRMLNRLGYGRAGSGRILNLVYNPLGPSLPPPQALLEQDYKRELRASFGIEFNQLFTITNMPIRRFAEALAREGRTQGYMDLLRGSFNPATVEGLMCRSLVSVSWDGGLYDCDFNQMLELAASGRRSIWEIGSFDELAARSVRTGAHCFGCTAGAGSSCGGSLR